MNQKNLTSIRVRGHLGPEWTEWFVGMTVTQDEDGTSTLVGSGIDQAALYGLLIRIRDLGLELLKVDVAAPRRLNT